MSDLADFDIKERVRQASDIVDVLGNYLELRRQGSAFVALCPWHDDHKPSLQINPARQTWKCWPCDLGGDVFSFVQQYDNVGFREALQILADRAGIQIRQFQPNSAPAGSPGDKQTLFAAMDWAQSQFRHFLANDPQAEDARRYLASRGINQKSIEHFGIGYAPESWNWLSERARQANFSDDVLIACDLMGRSERGKSYSRFRGRVMFPIQDIQDRFVAFGGRILPEIAERSERESNRPEPKYLNSRETRLFTKSDTLYGLNFFRQAISKQNHLVIVEGYTDVVGAWQAGLDNVVAVLGTALNERHLRLIRRYADRITLVLDGDQAGIKRANEILDLFVSAEIDLRILTLPENMDPFDYLEQHGAAEFRQLLSKCPDALDHKIAVETKGVDLINDTHQSNRALENILSVLARAPKRSSVSRVRSEQLMTRMSHLFGLGQEQIRNRLEEISGRASIRRRPNEAEKPLSNRTVIDSKEKELLQILCHELDFLDTIVENISPDQFVSGPARQLYELYCDCFHSGHDASFQSILTLTEDPSLKKLLVELDEEEQQKREHSEFQARKRLEDVFRAFELAELNANTKETTSRLSNPQLDDQEETDALLELLEQSRRRQGL